MTTSMVWDLPIEHVLPHVVRHFSRVLLFFSFLF